MKEITEAVGADFARHKRELDDEYYLDGVENVDAIKFCKSMYSAFLMAD